MQWSMAAATIVAGVFLSGAAFAADAPVQLKPSPAASNDDIPTFPRLVAAPDDKAAARINKALDKLDALTREAMKECRANVQDPSDFDFERSITVTMRGPHYLGFSVGGSQDCGGAHPASGSSSFVYDLTSGSPVNWQRLLPKSMVQGTSLDTDINGATIAFVTSKTLQGLWLKAEAAANPIYPDCEDAVNDPKLQLNVYPDAKAGGLAVEPGNFPHVFAACADTTVIPTAILRPLGVDAGLLDAIDAAHAGGYFDKDTP